MTEEQYNSINMLTSELVGKPPNEIKAVLIRRLAVSEVYDYDDFVREMWFYKPDEHGGCPELAYTALKFTGELGETVEKIGKAYRDNRGKIKDEEKFLLELGDVLFYLTKFAQLHGKSLDDIIKMNIKKLKDRKAAGTLRGEGDDR